MDPISGLVFLVVVAATALGCGGGWTESVSPNFKSRDREKDGGIRLPMGEFVLVDDGDGIFSNDNSKDIWVRNDRSSVSKTDPKLQEYLRSIGIDSGRMQGIQVMPLSEYLKVFKNKTEEMGSTRDTATVWAAYQQIVNAAAAAGIQNASGSPLYQRALEAAGQFGCYIPLNIADEFSRTGALADMELEIDAAATCAKDKKLKDQTFAPRLLEIRTQGLKQAARKLAESSWTLETLGDINKKMLSMSDVAKKNNIQDAVKEDFMSVLRAGYGSVISGILQRDDVKRDASEGKVVALENALTVLKGHADKLGVYDMFVADVKKSRIEGYNAALDAIKKREGGLADAKVVKERLDALERSAKEHNGTYGELRKQFDEVRRAVRAGIRK